MSSAQQAASDRREAARNELQRLGVPWRMEYGMWHITTPDGEDSGPLFISSVEWYCRGIADGINRVARGIAPMDTR